MNEEYWIEGIESDQEIFSAYHRNLSGIYLRYVLNLIPLIHITSILPIEITGVTSMSIQII